jgi:nucleotide-binding universal stress UspA family protein
MNAITKILVPVDFVAGARPAVEMAIDVAKRFEASVEFFHVWQPLTLMPGQSFVLAAGMGAPMPAEDVARAVAEAHLAEFRAQAKAAGVREAHCRVGVGDPAHDIVDLAATGHYDLIVMGTHGRTGLAHAFLGSVAEKVVRRATCPVLTVHARA